MEAFLAESKYAAGDVVIGKDESCSIIPMHNRFVVPEGLLKRVQYSNRAGIMTVDVFLGTEKTKWCHIYTKLITDKDKAYVLVNTNGITTLTDNTVSPLHECIISHLYTTAHRNNYYYVDTIEILVAEANSASDVSDLVQYLTTLDNSEYDDALLELKDELVMNDQLNLSELYDNYIHDCDDCGYIDIDSFTGYPTTINDLLLYTDLLFSNNNDNSLATVIEASVNIPCPKSYRKYDAVLATLLENGQVNRDGILVPLKHAVTDKADGYIKVKVFTDELLSICYKFMMNVNSQFSCKYILLNRDCPKYVKSLVALLERNNSSNAITCEIFKSCVDEVFVTVIVANGRKHKYFIDLTLVSLVCHGLRYRKE